MKQERRAFVKRAAIIAVILCLILCTFVACNKNGAVESIEVDEASNAGFYMLEGFNISTLKLRVTYENGDVNVINVEKSMLNTAAQNELKSSGQKEITINYQGKTTTVSFYLANEDEQVVEVTFKDVNGNKIAVVKTLLGGSVDAPEPEEVEGQTFRGWVDNNDNVVDLSDIQSSITVTASYSTSSRKYSVRFYDYKGSLITEDRVDEGASVSAPTYNKPAEIKSYSWNCTFPIIVKSNIDVRMSADYNYYSVDYAYAYESSRNDITRLNLHEDVKYGETARNFDTAKNQLPGALAETPIDSTTIYKNTTFLFILVSARVNITVYNNEDLSLIKVDSKEYLVNSTFTFPDTTPVAVAGKTFAGWKLYDGKKYSDTFASGATWKVENGTFGNNVKVVPYYTTTFSSVTFSFIFTDIKDENDNEYVYNKLVTNAYEINKSVITYADLTAQLRAIKVNNGGSEVSDNTDQGREALKNIADCEITSAEYAGNPFTVDSTVRVESSELSFKIKISALASGTKALRYTKVLALYDEPTVALPEGDEIASWRYDVVDVPCFPYVVDEGTFNIALLKYKTKFVDSFITDPGYYRLNVDTGTDIPATGWFTYNTAQSKFVPTTEAQTKTVAGTDYYGYYVPAGFRVTTEVTVNNFQQKKFYVFDSDLHAFKFATVFELNKTYFVSNYEEDQLRFDSGYFFGFRVDDLDSSLYEEGNNIYIPDFHNETVDGKEVARPVVAIADAAFATVFNEVDLFALNKPAYVIASVSKNLIKIGQAALIGCQLYDVTDFSHVSFIDENAFAGAVLAGNVSFASLKVMGDTAFGGLNFLSAKNEVVLNFSGELNKVASEAFRMTCGKVTVSFNEEYLKEIGYRAFYQSEELVAVSGLSGVKKIGNEAFAKTPLTVLDFPALEEVGTGAFSDMTALTALYLGGDGKLTQTTLDLNIISGSYALETLIIGKQDALVAQAAAGESEETTEKLITVTNSLGAGAYRLKKIAFPASITSIEKSIFGVFKFIEEIVVPENTEKYYTDDGVLYQVSNKAYTTYYYPVNKMGVYEATLPADATSLILEPAAFGDGTEVTTLDLSSVTVNISVLTGSMDGTVYGIKTASKDRLTVKQLSDLSKVYISGVTKAQIGSMVSSNDWDDKKVFAAESFTYYFDDENLLLFQFDTEENTAALIKGYRYAEKITVPAYFIVDDVRYSVNEIKTHAFYGFEDLVELDVQALLYKFPEEVFGDVNVSCNKLVKMTFAGWIDKSDENSVKQESFMYTAWYADHSIIAAGGKPFGYNPYAANKKITAEQLIESGFTTAITAKFFEGADITSISFPDTVITIEKDAFKNCTALTEVNFNRVSTIGDGAFEGCVALKKADVPALTVIGQGAFKGCATMTEFSAPELTRMSVSAFEDCSDLEKVVLTKLQIFTSNTQKNSFAFQNCSSLKEISLPAYTSDTLPGHVFHGCSSLYSFDFSAVSSVSVIGEQAFAECSGLRYILLGSSLIDIESSAFGSCDALNVQIPYSNGFGLYIATTPVSRNNAVVYYEGKKTVGTTTYSAKVYKNAFHPAAHFFISGDVDTSATFLGNNNYANVQTNFPIVSFEFMPDDNVDFTKWNNNISINDISDRIFFSDSDFTPRDLKGDGLSFLGWYTKADGSNTYNEISFPIVWTESVTVYARYVSDLRGTLDNDTDVSYVYIVEEAPEIFAETNEEVRKAAERALNEKVYAQLGIAGTFDSDGHLTLVNINNTVLRERISDPTTFLHENGIDNEWGEVLSWYYVVTQKDGTEELPKPITSFPFITPSGLAYGATVDIYATITAKKYYYDVNTPANCIVQKEVTTDIKLGEIGTYGYAIIKYSGKDSKNVILPDIYSDGEIADGKHGEAPIIAVYAGAFGDEELKATELKLPSGVRILLKGCYDNDAFTDVPASLNSNVAKLVLPSNLIYIEDGVFAGLIGLSEISFGEDSNLLYASRDSFVGTEWYKKAVYAAEGGANNYFVMAGRMAIEYVGKTSSLFVRYDSGSELITEYTDADENAAFAQGLNLGWEIFDEDGAVIERQEATIRLYDAAGNLDAEKRYVGTIEDLSSSYDELAGLYTITLKTMKPKEGAPEEEEVDTAYPFFTIVVYTRASENAAQVGAKKIGDVKSVSISNIGSRTDSCYRFITSKGDAVYLPNNAVKVADGILRGDLDMITLTVNTELVYIGEEAFYGSSLTSVNYADLPQNSKIAYVGANAFNGTPWYTATESVIIGTVYLKYNNTGTGVTSGGSNKKNTVSIPAYVTKIAEGAFKNATGLGGIAFNGTALTTIEKSAFAGSGITSITLPSSVTTVMRAAFMNCAALTDVNLSVTGITDLSQDAFFGCSAVTNIALPSSVTKIGKNAFRGTTSKLKTISAPGLNDVDVQECALDDTGFYSPERKDADQFIILGNVLVKYIMGKINVNAASSSDKATVAIEIPSSIKKILRSSFKGGNNSYITEVFIPASVEIIGQSAFEGCSRLKKVSFEEGSELVEIGAAAFKNCNLLSDIVLPDRLRLIGAESFMYTAIKTEVKDDNDRYVSDGGFTIPSAVSKIGDNAFFGVTTLTVLNLGPSIEEIGGGAFVTTYESAGVVKSGRLYKIYWNVGEVDMTETETSPFVKLTNYMNRNTNGELIRVFATDSNFKLRFYFPKQVVDGYIYENRLFWNTDEESSLSYICKEMDNEKSLPKITLVYDTATEIYRERIDSISDLLVPTVSGQTFVEWRIVDEATSDIDTGRTVTYPFEVRVNSLILKAKFIENDVHEGGATSINYTPDLNKSTDEYGIIDVDDGVKTLYVPATYQDKKVSSIELTSENTDVETIVFTKAENFKGLTTNIFEKYKALKTVLAPNDAGMTDFVIETVTINKVEGEGDDERTVSYTYQVVYGERKTRLIAFIGRAEDGMEFRIPAGITRICESAFLNSNLSCIYIPESVTQIDSKAFNPELSKLKIEKGIRIQSMTYEAFSSRDNESFWNKEALSSNVDSRETGHEYVEIKGLKQINKTEAGTTEGYFFSVANILLGYSYVSGDSLTMPTTISNFDITVLASNIFSLRGATFTTVTLPTKLQKINESAFGNCDITSGITEKALSYPMDSMYPQLTDIADGVFNELRFYKNANSSMVIIGRVLVKAKYQTDRIEVPENVETIMEDAFNGTQAKNVQLPSTLKRIGAGAFFNAQDLLSISIPNSVSYIGNEAFRQCVKLSSVEFDTLHSSLTHLGDFAFAECNMLSSLRLPANLQEIGNSAFIKCSSLREIYFVGWEITVDEDNQTRYEKKADSSLTKIGMSAFADCTSLAAIEIPDGVTEIKSNTFNGCIKLLEVKFNTSTSKLTEIGASAFAGCEILGSKLSEFVGSDETGYTTDLITLRLPNSLIRVEDNAFDGCKGLWGVLFNYNIDYLGANVFKNCTNLVKVVFYRDTPPTAQTDTFNTGNDALYRIRIYVLSSRSQSNENENYGSNMQNYITKWTNAGVMCNNMSIKYFIYELGHVPTLHIKANASSTTDEKTLQCDYYIIRKTSTNEAETMKYSKITQKEGSWYYGATTDYPNPVPSVDDRNKNDGFKAYTYGNQHVKIGEDDYLILIVDYDEMTVTKQ